jgi:hypothetical protein
MMPVKKYYAIRKSAADDAEWIWKKKAEAMHNHFDKVAWSEVILVCNYDKNGIAGYIGANTLLEMGLAFHLKKPIYLLNPLPEVSYTEEILDCSKENLPFYERCGFRPHEIEMRIDRPEDIQQWSDQLLGGLTS